VGSFPDKVRRRIKPNIVWHGKDPNLQMTIIVQCAPDGRLLKATITGRSGNSEWDAVAMEAVLHSEPMPVDETGRTSGKFRLAVRPAGE
jgi:colicin import membrane protein